MPTSNSSVHTRGITPFLTPARALAGAVAMAAAMPGYVNATQYALDYQVDTRYRYNDNVGLRSNNEVDVHGAELALPAKLSMTDERYTAYAQGEISTEKYDDSGYNSDNQELELGGDYTLERGGISASAGIDRDSTTNTAFLDNGIVGATADRVERYNAMASGHYYVTQETAAISGLFYAENKYDTPRLVDNENLGGYIGLSHKYTEKTTLQVRANASRFENDSRFGVESDTVGLQLGFSTTFTERLTVSALGGYSEVDTEYTDNGAGLEVPDDDSTSGWILNSAVEYTGDRSLLRASFVRRETASADGYLIVNNQLEVDYSYKLTERLKLSFETIAGTSGALSDDINNDRDFASGKLTANYQLTEHWFLTGGYTHRYQDRERAAGDASSNLVNLGIVFKPNPVSWSR